MHDLRFASRSAGWAAFRSKLSLEGGRPEELVEGAASYRENQRCARGWNRRLGDIPYWAHTRVPDPNRGLRNRDVYAGRDCDLYSKFGLFMNWNGTQKGEGLGYHLLAIAMAAFLMMRRAAALSVDRALTSIAP
jgi:hypothetical protein